MKTILLIGLLAFTFQQRNLSPRRGVTYTDHSRIASIDYSAPSVRGRKIWGELLPFGKPWGMGANESTKLTINYPVKLQGKVIPPGTYSLLAVFDEQGNWTLIVNKKTTGLFCVSPYTAEVQAQELGRFPVTVGTLTEPAEQLTYNLQQVQGEMVLTMTWEIIQLALPLKRA